MSNLLTCFLSSLAHETENEEAITTPSPLTKTATSETIRSKITTPINTSPAVTNSKAEEDSTSLTDYTTAGMTYPTITSQHVTATKTSTGSYNTPPVTSFLPGEEDISTSTNYNWNKDSHSGSYETTTSKISSPIHTTPPDTTFFTTPINTNPPVTTFVAMEEYSTLLPGYTSVGMTTPTMVATETTTSKSSTSINTTPPDTTFFTTPINTNPPVTHL
ncbi:hypothetical protein BSL78_19241 [Apostichopus japonicus]|uniref:Uncharacterized protein n=1 Tax=Stichopus japonicus TaxID=307972 RepID=A0A2G8K7C2_STIJA|nr:hypothetical protein BSL78_19241 [Apostichopus japonicus]